MTTLHTPDTVDPLYSDPPILIDEQRETPVPHRYVHGEFRGTPGRFSFYFPPREKYRGRFHHNTYPLADSADVGPFPIEFVVATGDIGFTIDSGAYYVQTNNGGAFGLGGADPSLAAYRANAAAAKFSRAVAADIYGDHRTYGYLYGGSGGAYQTLGGAELTSGFWDGFMPFVLGCNFATPSNFTVRMHALQVLRRREKLRAIFDAVSPGGSGDIFAGLDEEERGAIREATLLGFPLAGWYDFEVQDAGYFSNLTGAIPRFDPTYKDDFWSKPGYLGTDPGSSIRAERFQFDTVVARVFDGPLVEVELEQVPDREFANSHLVLLSGPRAGAELPIKAVRGRAVTFTTTADPDIVAAFQPGTRVRIDNSWPLALQTYHRHQVPPSSTFYGWNQFRDATGAPIYPQRSVLVGEPFTISSVGALLTGKVSAKTLLVQSHMDIDSFAWFADWYRSEAKAALGSQFDDMFALWFVERAQHEVPLSARARANAVSVGPVLQQGLRDLARWAEEGVHPSDTRYRVEATQIILPPRASERCGPQPVVKLTANGVERAEVAIGETVRFDGVAESPEGAGPIVTAEWDFEETGDFAVREDLASPADRAELSASHAYASPGTYFAVLRVTSQREGNLATPYARIQNLARVRIVVA